MNLRILCGAVGLFLSQPLWAAEIAITLDDLPYVLQSRTSHDQGLAQVTAITQALAQHRITATGFVVGQGLNRDRLPALQAFADAGHTIGNHSWSHPDYDTLTADEFRAETQKTHDALIPWLGTDLLYRFPFLREGNSEARKEAATAILAELGYQNVPVTIDNDEWMFNRDYIDAIAAGDDAAARQIGAAYIAHMQERTLHFQALAQTALGRDVKHILLLHMNQINADYLDELLGWYSGEGWHFITVQDAMTDPLYSAPDIYTGGRGLSQIERIMGVKSD